MLNEAKNPINSRLIPRFNRLLLFLSFFPDSFYYFTLNDQVTNRMLKIVTIKLLLNILMADARLDLTYHRHLLLRNRYENYVMPIIKQCKLVQSRPYCYLDFIFDFVSIPPKIVMDVCHVY